MAQRVEGGTLNLENPDSKRELLYRNSGTFVDSATFQFKWVSAHSWVFMYEEYSHINCSLAA